MPPDIRPGKWVYYNNSVGIINKIYNIQKGDELIPVIEVHYIESDGTTRMKLDETDPNSPRPVTDSEIVSYDKWEELEFLDPRDMRIPESRRRKY